MRKVNYEVKFANGAVAVTSDYMAVKESGAEILRTFLTEVNERSEKYKARSALQRSKVRELLKQKRG